jgi:hypothetical protein
VGSQSCGSEIEWNENQIKEAEEYTAFFIVLGELLILLIIW